MRRSRFVIVVAILTALIFCIETSAVIAASLSQIRKNIQNKQQELKENTEKSKDLSNQIESLEKQIDSKQADVDKLESAISEAETKLSGLKKELEEAERRVDQQDEDLNARLRNMYKNGSVGFLDVLLESDDISEFLTNLDMVQKVYAQDKDTLKELKTTYDEIDTKKQEIASLQEELTASKELAEEQKASLQADKKSVEKQKEEVDTEGELTASQLKQLEADQASLEAEIRAANEASASNSSSNNSSSSSKPSSNSSSKPSSSSSSKPSSNNSSSSSGSSSGKTYTHNGITMKFPLPYYNKVSSHYGTRASGYHKGVDLAVGSGTPIYAAAGGKVIRASNHWSWGNHVVISHGNGYSTLYAHCSKLLVKRGQTVSAGQQIAKVGSTGHSTGPHLHFEVYKNGARINPEPFIGYPK